MIYIMLENIENLMHIFIVFVLFVLVRQIGEVHALIKAFLEEKYIKENK